MHTFDMTKVLENTKIAPKETMSIHPTAIVDKHAELGPGVTIGAFSIIGPKVKIGANTHVGSHVTITGNTTIGSNNRIHSYAFIGTEPQDSGYHGEDTRLVVGDNNIIREYVTMSVATTKLDWLTSVGNANMIMSYCHVAHDCEIGDGTVLANCLNMSGHVKIEDYAVIGGIVGIHQFVTVGKLSFIGGLSRITQDVPPFFVSEGNNARVRCVNTVGLKRHDFDEARIEALDDAYRLLYMSDKPFNQCIQELKHQPGLTADVQYLLQFYHKTAEGSHGRAREAMRKRSKSS